MNQPSEDAGPDNPLTQTEDQTYRQLQTWVAQCPSRQSLRKHLQQLHTLSAHTTQTLLICCKPGYLEETITFESSTIRPEISRRMPNTLERQTINHPFLDVNEDQLKLSTQDLIFLLEKLQAQEPKRIQLPPLVLNQLIHYTQGWVEPLIKGLAALLVNHATPKSWATVFRISACNHAVSLLDSLLEPQDKRILNQIYEFNRITPNILALFDDTQDFLNHSLTWVDRQIFELLDPTQLHIAPSSSLIADALSDLLTPQQIPLKTISDTKLKSIYFDYLNERAYRSCIRCLTKTQKSDLFIEYLNLDRWGFFGALTPQDYAIINKHTNTTTHISCMHTESLIAQDLFLGTPGKLMLSEDTPSTQALNPDPEPQTPLDVRLQLRQSLHSRNQIPNKGPYQALLQLERQLTQHDSLQDNPLTQSALGKGYMDAGILVKGIEHLENSNINALNLGLTDLIITNQIYLSLCHFWCANQNHLYKMCYTNTHHFTPTGSTHHYNSPPGPLGQLPLSLWSEMSVFNYRLEQARTERLDTSTALMLEALDQPIIGILRFFFLINLSTWQLHQTNENTHAKVTQWLAEARDILEQNNTLSLKPLWSVFIFTSGMAHICNPNTLNQNKDWLSDIKPIMSELFDQSRLSTEEPNLWQCIAETMVQFIYAQTKTSKEHLKRLEEIAHYAEKSNYRTVSLYAHLFISITYWAPETQTLAKSHFSKAVSTAEQLNLNGLFILLTKQLLPLMKQAEQLNESRHFLNQISEQLNENNNRLSHKLDKLSQRELEILSLIAQGMTNEEIATHLDRSKGTIKLHVHNIYKKIGTKNRIEAIQNYTHWQKIHANLQTKTPETEVIQ